jgi:MFS family permease
MILSALTGTLLSLLACGAAVDPAMFIAALVGLGVSGALMMPAALALLTVPSRSRLAVRRRHW